MKGQFMLLTAIVGGLIMISISGVITSIQSQTYEPTDKNQKFDYIEREASKIYDDGKVTTLERENFEDILETMQYSTSVRYGTNSMNVTLRDSGEYYKLENLN